MVQELLPWPTLEQRLKELAARGEQMPQHEVMATITQLACDVKLSNALARLHIQAKYQDRGTVTAAPQ